MKPPVPVLAICLAVMNVLEVQAQVPIPTHKPGFVLGIPANVSVYLDVYIDLTCPDSKAAWPTVLQVAQWYRSDNLQLTTHLFPLPFHRFAFYTAKFAYVIEELSAAGNLSECGSQTIYDWFKKVFDNSDTLTNSATRNKTDTEVVQQLVDLVSELIPEINQETLLDMVDSTIVWDDTRVAWKYACTRGVAETPSYKVNDVQVMVDSSWTLASWQAVIDPLLSSQRLNVCRQSTFDGDCKSNTAYGNTASLLWIAAACFVSRFL